MRPIEIPEATYIELVAFLESRGVDMRMRNFDSTQYARYITLVDRIICEGIREARLTLTEYAQEVANVYSERARK